MEKNTQLVVQSSYNVAGEDYEAIRLEDPRGLLLSTFDIELVLRMSRSVPRESAVLEVGAGTGRFTIPMLRSGFRLIATDVNDSLLATLRSHLDSTELRRNCTVQNENVFQLSFPDSSFDFVYCIHVIPRFLCLEDQESAIREITRVLKPGGRFLFNYSNRSSLLGAFASRYVTPATEMEQILRRAQLDVRERRGKWFLSRGLLNRLPLAGGRFLARCERLFTYCMPSRAWDVFVLAEKKSGTIAATKTLKQSDSISS